MITIKNDFKNISRHYEQLVRITKQHYFVGITNEWIVDNYYLLIKNYSELKHFLKDPKKNNYLTKNFDMTKMLSTILENRNYKIDEDVLINDIKNYGIDIFVMGSDWENKFNFLKKYCEVIYLPRTPDISTTQIKKSLTNNK